MVTLPLHMFCMAYFLNRKGKCLFLYFIYIYFYLWSEIKGKKAQAHMSLFLFLRFLGFLKNDESMDSPKCSPK